jgi:hypothetical protein
MKLLLRQFLFLYFCRMCNNSTGGTVSFQCDGVTYRATEANHEIWNHITKYIINKGKR